MKKLAPIWIEKEAAAKMLGMKPEALRRATRPNGSLFGKISYSRPRRYYVLYDLNSIRQHIEQSAVMV